MSPRLLMKLPDLVQKQASLSQQTLFQNQAMITVKYYLQLSIPSTFITAQMSLPSTIGDQFTRGQRIFQGVSYSRPRTYISYNNRISKPYVLNQLDPETERVKELLRGFRVELDQGSDLIRGIRFSDAVVGRRHYHHNSRDTEYYIHQWKATNDLKKEHPTGSHGVYGDFANFFSALERFLLQTNKKI